MRKNNIKILLITPFLFNIVFLNLPIVAASGWGMEEACNINPDAAMCRDSQNQTAPGLAVAILNVIIGLIGVIAVINLIISGYRYVTAQGDPGTLAKARNGMIFSVVGLALAILSFAVINFVSSNIG